MIVTEVQWWLAAMVSGGISMYLFAQPPALQMMEEGINSIMEERETRDRRQGAVSVVGTMERQSRQEEWDDTEGKPKKVCNINDDFPQLEVHILKKKTLKNVQWQWWVKVISLYLLDSTRNTSWQSATARWCKYVWIVAELKFTDCSKENIPAE